MRNLITLLLLCAVLIFSAGCTMMSTMQGLASRTVEALRPTSYDGWDPASETGDPWVQQAAAEGRGNRPVEQTVDPFGLREVFMSEKARDIERNMGIE